MPTDTTRTRTPADQGETSPVGPTPARPLERAQLVWGRARAMGASALHDPFADALDLLRTARHDPSTLSHALTLGRTHLHAHPHDADAEAGARILQAAISFLGIKPRRGDVARPSDTN